MRRRNVQRDIFDKIAKDLVLRDEISLAVYLDEDPNLPLEMDIRRDDTLLCHPRRFFARASNALRAQNRLRLRQISLRLGQRPFAIHHASVCFIAELLDDFRTDLHGRMFAPARLGGNASHLCLRSRR